MTQARPHTPDDRPPYDSDAPGPAPALTDRWTPDAWRGVLTGAALAVLTLPAVAMVLVGLLVLAVQGSPTWLVVTLAALVTTLLGALGTVVSLRRGHPGVVHRIAVLAWVWGAAVVVAGVVLALNLAVPERVAVSVLLVLGGTYTLVLGLASWVVARVLPTPVPVPAADDVPAAPRAAAGPASAVPAPAVAPDDDDLADWPEWGAGGRATGDDATVVGVVEVDAQETPPTAPVVDEDVVDAEVVEPSAGTGGDVPRTAVPGTAPSRGPSSGPSSDHEARGGWRSGPTTPTTSAQGEESSSGASSPSGASSAVEATDAPRPDPAASATDPGRATTPSSTGGAPAGTRKPPASRPPRRSVTSSGRPRTSRTISAAGPATERIARQDGDDGPPTQRLPPVGR